MTQGLLAVMPLSLVRSVARATGRFVFHVIRYRRQVTLGNLAHAFPDISGKDRMAIARKSYESVAVTLFEFLLLPSMSLKSLREMVSIRNPELFENAQKKGRGLILLTAHFGSWELFAQASGLAAGGEGVIMIRIQANPFAAQEIQRCRTALGLRTISAAAGVREVLRTLSGGGWVVIAADQAAPKESVPVEFFGRPVPTYQGPAAFALQTGAEILLGSALRDDAGSYSVTFRRIGHDDLSIDDPLSVQLLTERQTRATEEMIRQDPAQWMWMHRRWKHVEPTE